MKGNLQEVKYRLDKEVGISQQPCKKVERLTGEDIARMKGKDLDMNLKSLGENANKKILGGIVFVISITHCIRLHSHSIVNIAIAIQKNLFQFAFDISAANDHRSLRVFFRRAQG